MHCFAYLRMIVFKCGGCGVCFFFWWEIGKLRGSAVFDQPLELLSGLHRCIVHKYFKISHLTQKYLFSEYLFQLNLLFFFQFVLWIMSVWAVQKWTTKFVSYIKKLKLHGQRIHLGIEKHLLLHFILKSCSILFKIVIVVKYIISSLCSFIHYIVCNYCDEIDKVKCISSRLCYIKRKCYSMEIVWSLHQFLKCRWEEWLLI